MEIEKVNASKLREIVEPVTKKDVLGFYLYNCDQFKGRTRFEHGKDKTARELDAIFKEKQVSLAKKHIVRTLTKLIEL